jgi:3-deoxy-manno-octulosonate cytidylyltransferase (CMP-KDO synthetase)
VHPHGGESNPAGAGASGARPRVVGAIPARYGSTRLAAKALLPLAGRPMIEHDYRRAAAAGGLDRVVVLTDDERIARAVRGFGGEVELTPAECASGTDRIAWAARGWSCDGVVNIQGDEPLIDPGGIARVADHLRRHPEDPIVTLAADAAPGDDVDPGVVKVVLDRAGYALYFSRAAIPYPRHAGCAPAYRHLGIYGYQRRALLDFAALEPTPLERAESLEQLRALEHGVRLRVLTGARPSRGVDTAEDAELAARVLEHSTVSEGSR